MGWVLVGIREVEKLYIILVDIFYGKRSLVGLRRK
jgi:hypothetical protein